MSRRKLRRLVVRVRCLVASCDGSLYVYDVSSQVATARCTCTMSRRKLRRPVVRERCLVASCDGSSYVNDVSSQVATARRTWTMSRRKLRRLVVRGRCLVASCDGPSYVNDVSSQVAPAPSRACSSLRRRRPLHHDVPRHVVVQGEHGLADLQHEGGIALDEPDLRAGDEAEDGEVVAPRRAVARQAEHFGPLSRAEVLDRQQAILRQGRNGGRSSLVKEPPQPGGARQL